MSEIDEATARRVIAEAEEARSRAAEEARLAKREQDCTLVRPSHFHATIYTFREKAADGTMRDSTHHEVLGLSRDSCVRKARNRAEPGQEGYHLAQLSECPDPSHGSRELRD